MKPSSSVTSTIFFTWCVLGFPGFPGFPEETSPEGSFDETSWRFANKSLYENRGNSLHGAKNGFFLSFGGLGGIFSLRLGLEFHRIRFFFDSFIDGRIRFLVFDFHFIRVQISISNSISSLQFIQKHKNNRDYVFFTVFLVKQIVVVWVWILNGIVLNLLDCAFLFGWSVLE